MSASNRVLDSAIRITLFACAFAGATLLTPLALQELAKTPQQRAESAERAEEEQQRSRAFAALCSGEDPIEQPETAQRCERARAQADLDAQEGMRFAAWSQVVISFAALVGLVFTVIFAAGAYRETRRSAVASIRAARHAKRQADIAKVALKESRQPAIYVDVESWVLELPNVPIIRIRVRNVGDNLAVVTGGRVTLRFGRPRVLSKEEIRDVDSPYISVGTRALRTGDPFTVEVPCLSLGGFENAQAAFARMTSHIESETFFCCGWVEYRDQWRNEYEEPIVFLYHPLDEPLKPYWTALNITALREE